MKNNLTYDEATARLEAIVHELEKNEAISLSDYKQKAEEAKELIAFCRDQLTHIETEIEKIVE